MSQMIYVVETASGGKVLRSYEGLSEEVVRRLVTEGGNPFEIVSKEAFEAEALTLPKYGP